MAFLCCPCFRPPSVARQQPFDDNTNIVVEDPGRLLQTHPQKPLEKEQDPAITRVDRDVTHRAVWEKAAEIARLCSLLTKEERAALNEKIASNEANSLQMTINEAKNAQQRFLDSRVKYTKRDGEVVIIRERVDRLLKGFEKYTRILDVTAGASEYAAIVWGTLRFFLQIFWNKIEIIENLEIALARIVTAMAACWVYESLYWECQQLERLQPNKASAAVIAEEMETALPGLHAAVLVFTIKCRTYFQKAHSLAGTVTALKPFGVLFKQYIDDIAEKQQVVEKLADMATAVRIKDSSAKLKKMFSLLTEVREHLAPFEKKLNEILETVRGIGETVREVSEGIHVLQSTQAQEVDEKALQWLDAQNPKEEFFKNKDRRMQGTCEWIRNSADYRRWKTGGEPHSLWVSGKPGAGKTVLASFLVEDLRVLGDTDVLYFFFKNGDIKTSLPTEALASLVLQLIHLANDRSPGLQRRLVGILKRAIRKGAGFADRGKADFAELLAIFTDMAREFDGRRVVVILDALDECLYPAVMVTGCLESELTDVARFIITSRPTQEIISTLGSSPRISTVQMMVEGDIKVFIEAKVAAIPNLKRHQATIISTVMERSSGMFRFAALLLEELGNPSPESISKRLKKMPTELDGMYEAILLRLGNTDFELRRMVLAWIATARRPLRVGEIACAFATSPFEHDFDPDDKLLVTEAQILKSCGSLVEIFNGDELRFTHLTVKEFLTSPPRKVVADERIISCLVKPIDAQADMAAKCLTQLVSPHLYTLPPGESSAFDYAIVHWVHHASSVQMVNPEPDADTFMSHLRSLVLDFAWENSRPFRHWKTLIQPYERSHQGHCLYVPGGRHFSDKIHPLHIAASYGLECVLDHPCLNSVATDQILNVRDGQECTPLIWAASNRHVGVARRLLQEEAVDVNAVNADGRSALTIASQNGSSDIIEWLIKRIDLDINIRDSVTHQDHSCNALSWAAWNGHEEVVRLLLTRPDLDPERIDSLWGEMPLYTTGDLPLHYAIFQGHTSIAHLLLADSRVSVNTKSRKGYTPLQVACRIGRANFVQLLLDNDADLSSVDIDNDTARDCALDNGHDNIVKILDDAQLRSLGTFDRAASLGDVATLETLVRGEGSSYSERELFRAMSYACEYGHAKVVKLLLAHQGDGEDTRSGDFASMLLWPASWRGDEELVSLLLNRPGININHKNPNGRTALSLAAQKGHHRVIRVLLSRPDIDINSQDKTEDTPLIWAAYHGHTEAVREIIGHPDVDPNIRNNYGDVALNYAVRHGHVEVVRLLLASPGIDVNTRSLQSNSPIHETALYAPARGAIKREHRWNECLRLLLARTDLDINVRRDTGDTILSVAVGKGFEDQVAILLARKDIDRHPVSKKGETPLSTAKWLGYDKIVALLAEN